MDTQIIQNLRYKLQKRIRRLNSIDAPIFFPSLRQFWVFFDSIPLFLGIIESLLSTFIDIETTVDKIFQGEGIVGDSEAESAAIGYLVTRKIASFDQINPIYALARNYGHSSNVNEALETIRDTFIEPFYEYIDESLDDQRAMLHLLLRYKHQIEWFQRNRLLEMIENDSRHAEKLLALDLYGYLYDKGIDFNIEPSSISGEIDLIAAQGTEDPLLADTKIFDAVSRGKAYIQKGFNQIYTYTQQYNEPFGYLIIFKTSEIELQFSLSSISKPVPIVTHNHKTIFFIVIDLYSYSKPVSQRDPLRAIEITEEELIDIV